MDQDLKNHARDFKEFFDTPLEAQPLWVPSADHDGVHAWDDASIDRIKGMLLPEMRHARAADLVLYRLGRMETVDPSFSERMDAFTQGDDHMWVPHIWIHETDKAVDSCQMHQVLVKHVFSRRR